jgi:outer membrane protein OmpA-like peptidoglycan-associated protein
MTSPARLASLVSLGLCVLFAPPAVAGEPESEASGPATDSDAGASAEGSVSLGGDSASSSAEGEVRREDLPWKLQVGRVHETTGKKRDGLPWLHRWAPERLMGEIGIYGGLFLPSEQHDFYNPDSGHKPLWILNGEVGIRAAFFPLRYLGVEAEGEFVPAKVRTSTNDLAPIWGARGHLIAQLPMWNVAPFLLVGAGAMGAASNPVILGHDVDPAVHWGGGVKIYINRWVGVRIDGRHVLAAKQATQNSVTSHAEVQLGLIFTLGRAKPFVAPPPNPDRDGDGFLNERDDCPDTPGVSPDGCPPRDTDEDGWVDTEDACPYEAGVEPDGCPIRDKDGDGIPDEKDQCIDRPETDNGFEDEDGCPDEIPDELREFTGVIQGIQFETKSTAITADSKPTLDRAIKVLEEYPDIRIEIVGHTDNVGAPEDNDKLSKDRAAAVKTYLVEGGIDDSRIETKGKGESQPIATNETEEGRAQNRRTEFKILQAKSR